MKDARECPSYNSLQQQRPEQISAGNIAEANSLTSRAFLSLSRFLRCLSLPFSLILACFSAIISACRISSACLSDPLKPSFLVSGSGDLGRLLEPDTAGARVDKGSMLTSKVPLPLSTGDGRSPVCHVGLPTKTLSPDVLAFVLLRLNFLPFVGVG